MMSRAGKCVAKDHKYFWAERGGTCWGKKGGILLTLRTLELSRLEHVPSTHTHDRAHTCARMLARVMFTITNWSSAIHPQASFKQRECDPAWLRHLHLPALSSPVPAWGFSGRVFCRATISASQYICRRSSARLARLGSRRLCRSTGCSCWNSLLRPVSGLSCC